MPLHNGEDGLPEVPRPHTDANILALEENGMVQTIDFEDSSHEINHKKGDTPKYAKIPSHIGASRSPKRKSPPHHHCGQPLFLIRREPPLLNLNPAIVAYAIYGYSLVHYSR
jgi:hypothetical protein